MWSYTYKKKFTLIVSKEWLHETDHVLIIDDFMAKGNAVQGLIDIVTEAKCTLEGIGIAIEKGFQGGGDALRDKGLNYKALAVIDEVKEDGTLVFRKEDL